MRLDNKISVLADDYFLLVNNVQMKLMSRYEAF